MLCMQLAQAHDLPALAGLHRHQQTLSGCFKRKFSKNYGYYDDDDDDDDDNNDDDDDDDDDDDEHDDDDR